jgi:exo-1,4-beta-D-glucosaminidase
MGEPKLHNATIKVSYNNNSYIYKKQIGFRQVESELIDNKRLYKINKKNLLLKGAGWTPDLFLRQSAENYYNHINYVKNMELNVIRLEGKSEGEEFYDYCDKMGILIISGWNCADAWQRWKYWSTEVERLSNISVVSQIRKLSPHPSVIIFILGSDMAPTNGIEEKWRVIFNEEKWPNEILSSAASSSGEGYPTGVKMSGPYSWVPPNYFYLNISRNETYGGAWGFLTEGGPGENPLRKGSYEKVFNIENQKNYKSDSWKYHCGNKVIFGSLDNLTNPIEERYGKIKDFEDFQKKSSAAVYEGHRAMFEAYSCYRYDSTGVIHWMLNNAWPSNIWHLYDYFFAPTPAYFATKKAGEKIHFMYNYENKTVFLINNYFSDYDIEVELNIYFIDENGKDIKDKKIHKISKIKSDEIFLVEKILGNYGNHFLHLEYSYEGMNIATNTYILSEQMDVINYNETPTFYNVPIITYANFKFLNNLENVTLTAEVISKTDFVENGQNKERYIFKIKNEGKTIALLLEIKLYQISGNDKEIVEPIIWSDNYFSIRGENSYEVTAEFSLDKNKELHLDIVGRNCELKKKLN